MLDSFIKSITLIGEMFVLLIAGFVCKKKGLFTDRTLDGGNDLLMWVFLPANILMAAHSSNLNANSIDGIIKLVVITLIDYVVVISLGFLISRFLHYDRNRRATLVGAIAFKNLAFLGLPLCETVLGSNSIVYVAFCMLIFTVIIWTFGVVLYSGGTKISLKKMFENPSLIACLIMILLLVFPIELPEFVWEIIDMAGKVCTPLSIIMIGMMLANANLGKIFKQKRLILSSLFCMLIDPLIIVALVALVKPPKDVASVLCVLSCVPAATLNAIVAKNYGGDGEETSASIVHGMVISLVTMPFVITFTLNCIGYY